MTDIEYGHSDAQLDAILGTFEHEPGLDRERFRECLERCAWLYFEAKTLSEKILRPAKRSSQLKRLRGKISALSKVLAEARNDPFINRILNAVASKGRSNIGHSQYEEAGELGTEADPIQRLTGELFWFEKVVEQAEREAAAAKNPKGGNRPDVAFHELILALDEIYKTSAVNPRSTSGWSADSGADEFLRFLQSVLRPLGVAKSDSALREIYRDAMTNAGA